MGWLSFTQEIAVDLGTANTIISTEGKIVVDEPSVVALDGNSGKMIAVGEQAKLWYEKSDKTIKVIRPLKDGVIADFNACEQMIRGLIKKCPRKLRLLVCPVAQLRWNFELYVTLPSMLVVGMYI